MVVTMPASAPTPVGFGFSRRASSDRRRRSSVLAQLVATIALVVSIALLMMAVSMQMAEARPLEAAPVGSGGLEAAGVVSLFLVAVGGLTVLVTGMVNPPRR